MEADMKRINDSEMPGIFEEDKYTMKNVFMEYLKAAKITSTDQNWLWRQHCQRLREALEIDEIFSLKVEYLQACIETIAENRSGNLNVLELGGGEMKDTLVKLFGKYSAGTLLYDVLEAGISLKENMKSLLSLKDLDLIVIDNMLHTEEDPGSFLQACVKYLDDSGFLLIKETTKHAYLQYLVDGVIETSGSKHNGCIYGRYLSTELLKNIFDSLGLVTIYDIRHPFLFSLVLLRKKQPAPFSNNKIISVSNLDCTWLAALKKTILELKQTGCSKENIWLYADNNYSSGIVGMTKCLRKEPDGLKIRCVLNKRQTNGSKMKEIVDEMAKRDLAINILNDDGIGSYRYFPCNEDEKPRQQSEYYFLDILNLGDLSSLTWFQSTLQTLTQDVAHEICKVQFASLNFRDVMLATGKLNQDAIPGDFNTDSCLLGMEFSGTDSNGHRVMGIVPSKALASHVDVRKDYLWMIPDNVPMTDAASIPVAYSTAYYALIVRGRLNRGQKVLIHSGSGGVGQAAIRIAQSFSCEIFTTVGTEEKKTILLSVFPKLKAGNIFSSRDTAFEAGIMDATTGKGVDIVLNSLSGEKLRASLNVVAVHGCFLEIGKFDLHKDTGLGMSYFLKNISFHGILLDSLFEAGNNAWKSVHLLVDIGIKSGVVKPLKTTVFNRENVEAAFRYMAQGKHIGKILIEVNSGGKLTNENAVPKYFCDSKKSYVIIGGLGGFGLELAQWLATRGARSIVLTSRSGIKNGYQARKIRKLRKIGIDVRVCRKNAGDVQEAIGIIEECGMPCGGIFNTAMVLEDGLIENQTVERFQKVIEPKLTAAINLDKVTRQLCMGTCDLFVMFSSASSGRGNAGQSNYGFANSGMEMICEQRRRDGLHGLAIQWGVIGDVGVLFEQSGSNETEIAGVVSQRIRSCLATLDTFLTQSAPIVTSFVQAKAKMANKEKDSGNTDQNLLKAVCNIIGINDASKVDKKLQLEDMGLDSLMAVEIKQTIERLVDVGLTTTEIRKLTLNGIKELVNERSLRLDYGQDAKNKENVDRDPKWSLDDILIPAEMIVPVNKFESIKDPIYFIHMVEGSTGILRHVASFIDRPAFGIQSTKNVPQSSVTDMAAFYLQAILEHNRSQEFHLAGYSFGGMIAMEIGYQIQRSSHSSKLLSLTLLDGTPLSVSSSIRMFYESQDITNELDKQSVPLAVLGGLLLGEEAEPIFQTLKTLPTFDVRTDMLLSRLAGYKLAVSRKDLVDAVKAYKQKHATALAYSFPGKYKGDVVLIVPGHWTIERKTLGQDQGLKKIVDGSVNVYEVPGRHLTFLQGSSGQQVANHINEDLNKRTQ